MIVSDFLKTIFKTLSFIRCRTVGRIPQPWIPPAGPAEQEPTDPASKREEKIARYKRCKELDEKVAYLFLGKNRWLLRCEIFWKKYSLILPGVMIPNPFLFGLMGWKYQSVGLCIVVVEMIHRWILHHFIQDMRIRKMQTLGLKKTTLGIWQIIWINGFCATFFKRAPHVLFWLCLCRFSKKREDLGDEYLWGAGSSFDEDMASRTGSGGRCVSEIHLKIGWEKGKNQQFTCAFFQTIWCSSISLMIIILHVKVKTCGYQTVPPLIPRKGTWFWCCCGVLWPR